MAERIWTGPQADAIDARGGTVLVSAAAGSGKTAVLVERVVKLICDPLHPVDADRLLVVTFSRAAAAEMKQRMGARIAEMVRENPGDANLQRQQALLASAHICTVDSFCLDLVRQNFQNLAVSPDFAIIDQTELTILMNDCVSACIDWYYDNDHSGVFQELVELLSSGRDDALLAQTVLRIYDFSRSHPFFEDWLEEKLAMYGGGTAVEQTVWGASILAYATSSLTYSLELTKDALERIAGDEKMEKAYWAAYSADAAQLERCLGLAQNSDWDSVAAALQAFRFEKLGPLRGEDSVKQRVKAARDQVKDIVKELAGKYLNATGAQFREDLDDLRPKITLLFRMVSDFADLLWKAKLEKKRLHFSDLEHLALQLLVQRTEDGVRPSPQAEAIAQQYDYVLVDEYQDTNEVQDLLFRSVSREERNLFMVGDVKQSIYGFRQAMPEIFLAKKERFQPYSQGRYPAKIILDTNFRSRREVTDAVNGLFGCMMSRALGDVDYGEEEQLRCGARYPAWSGAQPELLLLGTKDSGPGVDPVAAEAGMIAQKIRAMLDGGYQVADGGELRPAMLRDFCILMRSPRGRANAYIKELARHGIVASAETAGGYLEAREVAAVVSLLRALDNPLLDIELVAAMLSPLFDFDADDIARIRLAGQGKPFFIALQNAAREGDGKAEAFLAVFHHLRARSAVLPADRLLLQIYERTDALAVYQAMAMGENRRANLLLLVEYAATYHAMGYKQLGGFVGFLGRLTDRGGDLQPAGSLGDSANTVRIMSIHRSKGLEFPVVFLADTAKLFNKVDLRQNTLLHSRYGFACVRRDHETFRQYPTVPMQAIRLEAQRSILAEEMRILYVALTRAREKLILTGTVRTDLRRKLAGLCCEPEEGRLPAYLLGECGSYLDWILMALLHHPTCAPLREAAGVDDVALLGSDARWSVTVTSVESGEPATCADSAVAPVVPADPELLLRLRERAGWRYPWSDETRVPAKLSVSAVSKGEQDIAHRFKARPRFLTAQRLTPAERGNAMHKFMQFSNYEAARDNLDAEITRMRRERYLSDKEADSLQTDKLREFFDSELARRIFGSEKVYRELKFTAECGQDMLGDTVEGLGDSKIILQGVADCVFVEQGAATIVDYKTDRVASPQELVERYSGQLALYRAILSRSLGLPVGQCVLYSFHLSHPVAL